LGAGLSACGGSSTSTTTRTITASTTSTGPTAAQKATDQAIANNSTLKLSDFPSGWVQADKASSSTLTCPSIKHTKEASSGEAIPPQFTMGDTDGAQNATYVFPSEAGAQQAFQLASSAELRACLAHAFAKALRQATSGQAQFGAPETGQLSIPAAGDESSAGRVTIPYTASGISFSFNADIELVRVGRGLQLLAFYSADGTPDSDLEAQLTKTAADRLQTALATPNASNAATTPTSTAPTSATSATGTAPAEKVGSYSGVAPASSLGPATGQSVCPGVAATIGPHTSCSFAANVVNVVRQAYMATGHYPASVTAYSPVTGQTYVLSCNTANPSSNGTPGELECSTGTGGEVTIPLPLSG
jgi:hypothetical protein